MSRVDDDSQDRRVQERLALEKQRLADKNKEKVATDSRFAKLVFKTGSEKTKSEQARQDSTGRDVIDRMKGFGSRIQRSQPEGAGQGKGASEMDEASRQTGGSRTQGDDALSGMLEDRHQDSRVGGERLEERKESQDNDATAHLGARDKAREDSRAGAGGGGASGGGGQDKDGGGDKGAAAAQGFRFNPALMAPVAVAQPRTGMMSDKLRQLANEIAQKIVQNVRVGTNRAGEAEFQIDLKSSVLSGLQIKISGKHGKITAVFSGKDTEVLKLIKQNADGLKSALQGRGLVLADLRFEEKK